MPIFEYKCSECDSKFEILTKSNDDHKASCLDCNSSKVNKLFSAFSTSTASVSFSDNGCTTGIGNVDVPNVGGCAYGMCGLN